MSRTVRRARPRAAVLAAVAAAALAVSATPAASSSMFFSKSSGTLARAEWYEVGELPGGVVGNAHLGYLDVEDLGKGRANVFGYVDDYACDPGSSRVAVATARSRTACATTSRPGSSRAGRSPSPSTGS